MSTVHSGLRHKLRSQFSKNAKLQEKYDRLEKAALKLREAIKWAVKDEREAIFEANGCPGFDGPMTIETKYDKVIAEFDEAIKGDE